MQLLDDMSINEVLVLYNEMREAIQSSNVEKLAELKGKCPAIFVTSNYSEINEMFNYLLEFQQSDRYKEMCHEELREKLSLVSKH